MTTWKAVIGVILIFVFGFFSGTVCTSIYAAHRMTEFMKHPGAALMAVLEKRLTGNLGLDAGQKEKIDAIFQENLKQRQEVQKTIQPEVQTINRETLRQINEILRPDQLNLFHENIEKVRKRFGQEPLNSNAPQNPAPAATPIPSAPNPAAPK